MDKNKIEIEKEEHERECFNCGDVAEPETGFLFECNLYCSDLLLYVSINLYFAT